VVACNLWLRVVLACWHVHVSVLVLKNVGLMSMLSLLLCLYGNAANYLLRLVLLFRTRNRRALLQYTIETSEELIRRRLEAGQKSGSAARRCGTLLINTLFDSAFHTRCSNS
jgi:Flp pilus assembly protein TadB